MKRSIIATAVFAVTIVAIVGTLLYQTCLAEPSFKTLVSTLQKVEIKAEIHV